MTHRGRAWRTTAAMLALVVCTATAYVSSFSGVFLFDDGEAIVENTHLRSLWPLTEAMRAPAGSTLAGRPMASLSFALTYALDPPPAGDVPATTAFHAVNLAIHLAAAFALFGVTRRTLESRRLQDSFGEHATSLAFAVTLLWALHPLQTSAVTYIVQRVEALMALFYLVTLYCGIRALDARGARRVARLAWTSAAVIACALGMGTKESMVSAPIVVWLWDRVFTNGDGRRAGRPVPMYLPLHAGLAGTWVLLGLLVATNARPDSTGFGHGWTWWSYLSTQAGVLAHYVRLVFLPHPLVLDYGWTAATTWTAILLPGLPLAVAAIASVIGVIRRHPAGWVGTSCFLILAPSSSVYPIATEVAAEHRMYLPLAGVLALVVIGARHAGRRWVPAPQRALAGAVLLVIAASTLGWRTHARNLEYANETQLWLNTIAHRPENARARMALAIRLLAAGRPVEAEGQLRESVRLEPGLAPAHMHLGIALFNQGRMREAAASLERAAILDARLGQTQGLLAEVYLQVDRPHDAVAAFERALAIMPDTRASRFLRSRLAWILATAPDASVRNGIRAVMHAERAVAGTGGADVAALESLAAALAEVGRFDDARAVIARALAEAERRRDATQIASVRQQQALFVSGQPLRVPLR